MKKIMTGIAITALLIGAGIFFVIKTYSKTIILTPEMIQARLDEKFPVSKKKYFTNFVITDPEVLLEEGSDRIGLGISVNITTPEIIIDKKPRNNKFNGEVHIDGKLEYDAEAGAVFLKDTHIVKISLNEIPKRYMPLTNRVINPFVESHVNNHPIYKLKSKSFSFAVARLLLREVYVKSGNIHIVLGFSRKAIETQRDLQR